MLAQNLTVDNSFKKRRPPVLASRGCKVPVVTIHPLQHSLYHTLPSPETLVKDFGVDNIDPWVLDRVDLAPFVLLKVCKLWPRVDVFSGTLTPLLVIYLEKP